MSQVVYKEQKNVFDRATHKGELLLRDVGKEPEAVDVRMDKLGAVVKMFSGMVQMHTRIVPSEGAIESAHRTSLLDDAIQVTIGFTVESGYCLHGRKRRRF